jgi:uncharacterized protein (DUF488 family)
MTEFLYTVGHSNHSTDKLIELLTSNDVTAVADVRSTPYSRYAPQFNREMLCGELRRARLAYVFMGHQLGGRSTDRSCYVDGRLDYSLVAKSKSFLHGLARLTAGMSKHRIALLCAERDPLMCHRAILVCRHLDLLGVRARHILGDGGVEDHRDAILRLLIELGMSNIDLFRNGDQQIADAYERRGTEIAYTETPFGDNLRTQDPA